MPMPSRRALSVEGRSKTFRPLALLVSGVLASGLLLTACGGGNVKPNAPPAVVTPPPKPAVVTIAPIKIGVALGGGAAKGFAHIGVLKMLEANGFKPMAVSGTSAGSVVGALYASGIDVFALQKTAFALDETSIRDVSLFSGGVVKGQKLQDYVNQLVGNKPMDKMKLPFAAVSTRLETGEAAVFTRGNTGQAVRASSSIPGVFEPVKIGKFNYVDGGVVSPVPVDAARQLGAEFVIAVDISTKAAGGKPQNLLGVVNQSITIMGEKLGAQELARADIVIRPKVNDIGAADFEQRNVAILEGERAALAVMPQIRAKLEQIRRARIAAATPPPPKPAPPKCEQPGRLGKLLGRDPDCTP